MLNLNDGNFEREMSASQKPVLVDFWAGWCFPCTLLSPILEKIAEDFKNDLLFAKVNIDIAPLLAQKFSIDQIPTVMLFKEGKPINSFIGLRTDPEIRNWLRENLK